MPSRRSAADDRIPAVATAVAAVAASAVDLSRHRTAAVGGSRRAQALDMKIVRGLAVAAAAVRGRQRAKAALSRQLVALVSCVQT